MSQCNAYYITARDKIARYENGMNNALMSKTCFKLR